MRYVAVLALIAVALALVFIAWPNLDAPSPGRRAEAKSTAADLERATVLESAPGRASSPSPVAATVSDQVGTPSAVPARWHLLARVRGEEGEGIAGATVALWLTDGTRYEFLRDAQTGPDGTVDVDLTSLASRTRNRLARQRIMGWAFVAGHASSRGEPVQSAVLSEESLEPGRWRMTLDVFKWPVIHGRIVDAEGRGLGFVHCRIAYEGEVPDERVYALAYSAPDGRFAVPNVSPTVRQLLLADLRGHRRARSAWFKPEDADVIVPDIRMELFERVPGMVRFPDGSPVVGLTLPVWRVDESLGGCMIPWRPDFAPIVVRTDDAGRFSLALSPLDSSEEDRPYQVQLRGRSERRGIELDWKAPSHVLTLQPHRLRVQIHDEQGVPLPGVGVAFHGKPDVKSEGETDSDGETSLFPLPGSSGEIRFLAIGNQLVRRPVDIPRESNESVQRFTVSDPDDLGTLVVRLVSPDGLPIESAELQATTTDGITVAARWFCKGVAMVSLPAGTYVVSVRANLLPWFPEGRRLWSTQAFTTHVVRAGETLDCAVLWTRTAGLSLLARPRGDAAAVLRTATLKAKDGKRHDFYWDRPSDPTDARLPWHETVYAEDVFEPGDYTLVLETEDHAVVQRDVRLVHGKIEHVEVELGPQK